MTGNEGWSRRSAIIGAAALWLAGCALGPRARQRDLKVATLNIWHDAGDWPARLPLIVDALRQTDADIIALQEVLEDAAKGLPNQAATIAAMLGGYSVHFSSTSPPGSARRYGNAIITRLPVVSETTKTLQPLNDYRTAVRIRAMVNNRPIDAVCTHLAWQADAGPVRARQIADLMAWLPQDGVPLIVLGDFNAPLGDPGLAALTAPRFASALREGATASTLNPAKGHAARVIDHIFAESRRFAVLSAGRFADEPRNGVHASDHFGVAANLRLL